MTLSHSLRYRRFDGIFLSYFSDRFYLISILAYLHHMNLLLNVGLNLLWLKAVLSLIVCVPLDCFMGLCLFSQSFDLGQSGTTHTWAHLWRGILQPLALSILCRKLCMLCSIFTPSLLCYSAGYHLVLKIGLNFNLGLRCSAVSV